MFWIWLVMQLGVPGRNFHTIPLDKMATTKQTHVCTTGPVVYVRKQADGDWHITLDNGTAKVVAEIIPLIPLPPPRKGDTVTVCGIRRNDDYHHWGEIHPVEALTVVVKSRLAPL